MCYPISTKPYSTLNKIIKKSTVSTVYKSLFQLLLRPQLFSFSTLCWLSQFNNKLIRKAKTGILGNCFRQTSKSLDIDIDICVRFTDKDVKGYLIYGRFYISCCNFDCLWLFSHCIQINNIFNLKLELLIHHVKPAIICIVRLSE